MFSEKEIASVFEAASQQGLTPEELYVESVSLQRTCYSNRCLLSTHHDQSGICLKTRDKKSLVTFRSSGLNLNKLLKQLGAKGRHTEIATTQRVRTYGASLAHLLKKMRVDCETNHTERSRRYWVARPNEPLTEGQDEWAEMEIDLETGHHNLFSHHLETFAQPDSLFIPRNVKKEWPFPRGVYPVIWSAESIAKILLPFLRAFEGDLVLTQKSFLRDTEMECLFHLIDRAPHAPAYDAEGSLRRDLHFFDGKTPRIVPCDRSIADIFGIAPTGHSHRYSYRTPSVIGLWNVEMREAPLTSDLVPQVSHGVWVKDLDIAETSPSKPEITLTLTDCVLIHQGQPGEGLTPIRFSIPLTEILKSFRLFEKTPKVLGAKVVKKNQPMGLEMTVSAALSDCLNLPGETPSSHYW